MPSHLPAPNGAKRSYKHDLTPTSDDAAVSLSSKILSDKIAALARHLGPPPVVGVGAAPPAPLTTEQEAAAAIRRIGAPSGQTSLEAKFQAKYERLVTVNPETAEAYAQQIMRQAAERIYGSKQNLTDGPDGKGKILPLIQRGARVGGKEKRRLARSMGKKKLSQWEDCYVDTLGSICGCPVLLVESLGEGEGVLEFGCGGVEGEEGEF